MNGVENRCVLQAQDNYGLCCLKKKSTVVVSQQWLLVPM